MTISFHSISSYHVPFHNMLKWIILIQNLLYNNVKWHLYIWLQPFGFLIFLYSCCVYLLRSFYFLSIKSLLWFFLIKILGQHSWPFIFIFTCITWERGKCILFLKNLRNILFSFYYCTIPNASKKVKNKILNLNLYVTNWIHLCPPIPPSPPP